MNWVIGRLIFLFVFVFFLTYLVIQFQTPEFKEFTFTFTCTNNAAQCEARIEDAQRTAIQQGVNSALRNSQRLGKLSEVYQSVMRFHLYIKNDSDAYIKIASTSTSKHFYAEEKCGEYDFTSGSTRLLLNDFALSDSPTPLLNSTLDFIGTCNITYITPTVLNTLPPVPPKSIVEFEYRPAFLPELKADHMSWPLVFIFNLLITMGLFPVFREGYRFVVWGFKQYFSKRSY